ncbi:hypothetical protein OSTOST_05775, partial [Ostertagia ostertagi]
MVSPNSLHDDVHKQVTAVCHFLFTHNATRENYILYSVQESLLEVQLKSRGTQWSTAVQLAGCSRGDRVVKLAAQQLSLAKNQQFSASTAGLSALNDSDFSLHYNARFRRALWTQIGKMTAEERSLLFSADEVDPRPASKILVHSIRTLDELSQVRSLVESWDRRCPSIWNTLNVICNGNFVYHVHPCESSSLTMPQFSLPQCSCQPRSTNRRFSTKPSPQIPLLHLKTPNVLFFYQVQGGTAEIDPTS